MYHVVLNAALIHTCFTLCLDSMVRCLELRLETVQKLKSSLCLFVRQHFVGSANKIASWLLGGFKMDLDLQSIRNSQGPGIREMAPLCSIPVVWGGCSGFRGASQWHPLPRAQRVHPFLCSTKLFPHLTAGLVRICNCNIIELSGLVYGCVGS